MPPVIADVVIDRPAQDVFEYITDPTRFHEWQKGVVSGEMATTGPTAVGDRCLTTRQIGLAKRASTSEVSHVDPPRSWGVRGVDGPIRAIIDVTVEPLSDTRSELTISVDFTGHGIGKALVPLVVRREAEKEMPANLAKAKRLLEG
jgi:uncharacterized protein YndB with AHSA1/START domain